MSYINQFHGCVLFFFYICMSFISFQQELGASVPFLIYLVVYFWLSVRLLLSSPRCLSKSYTVVYHTCVFFPPCIIFNDIAVN